MNMHVVKVGLAKFWRLLGPLGTPKGALVAMSLAVLLASIFASFEILSRIYLSK